MTVREKLILIEAVQIRLTNLAGELTADTTEPLEGLGLSEDCDTLDEMAKDAVAEIEVTMEQELVS